MTDAIYLDYSATTPLHPEVRARVGEVMQDSFGNPSSLHREGRQAAKLLADARHQVAVGIGAREHEIIFTSGATEAINLALRGALLSQPPQRRHVITTAIEHHAVLHTLQALERDGCRQTILPVSSDGQVDPQSLRRALEAETALVCIMMVNNEMGAVQPIAELCAIAHEHGALFHTDAVQGMGTLEVDVGVLGIDLLSFSGHKIYGPKGSGALFAAADTRLDPILYGGPQEAQRRAGTENLPAIVGLGEAVTLVNREKPSEAGRLSGLRNFFIENLSAQIPDVVVYGGDDNQAPHIISLVFPGVDAEALLFRLDQAGISASMGSACNAEAIEPSHVLLALGASEQLIRSSLRFSMGMWTDQEQLVRVIELLPELTHLCRDDGG